MKTNEIRVGLPSQYAKAMCAGVDLAKNQLSLLPSGKFVINCAAHDVIASSEAVFKHLAAILIKLIAIPVVEYSDEMLLKLFPTNFS